MARKRDPARDEAKRMWLESSKKIPLKDIAAKLGKPPSQVRKWKSLDGWDSDSTRRVNKKERSKGNVTNGQRERSFSNITEELAGNDELTDKQKMFCLYYLQRFNATWAYMKAYGVDYNTASVNGSRLLGNAKVQKQLDELKKSVAYDLHLTVVDIAHDYAKQAFADMGDYVNFVTTDTPIWERLYRKNGPFIDNNGHYDYVEVTDPNTGEPAMHTKHEVRFKDQSMVDTSLISKVKTDKGEIDLELYDKQKALDALTKLVSDQQAIKAAKIRKLEAEAEIAEIKAEQAKKNGTELTQPINIVDRWESDGNDTDE
jgi:phage terminase small subunit